MKTHRVTPPGHPKERWGIRWLDKTIMVSTPGQWGATYIGPGYVDVAWHPRILKELVDLSTPC